MGNRKSVIFNCPYSRGTSAIRWIAQTWRQGFGEHGYSFQTCDEPESLARLLDAGAAPDIILCDIVASPFEDPGFRRRIQAARARGTRVACSVFWPLYDQPPERVTALRELDVADLYYGEREEDSMATFVQETGKPYCTLPHAANPEIHFKTQPVPDRACQILYVGARLRLKEWFNQKVLLPLRKKYDVRIHGPGWSRGDLALRAASKGFRKLRLPGISERIDQHRSQVPDDEISQAYSSARIVLNFHEREADGSQPHHVVSQRTFHIAACGGFQLVDPVIALDRYFPDQRIVTARLDPADWFDKIAYFLDHDQARQEIAGRAHQHARQFHLASHRVARLLGLLGLAAQPS